MGNTIPCWCYSKGSVLCRHLHNYLLMLFKRKCVLKAFALLHITILDTCLINRAWSHAYQTPLCCGVGPRRHSWSIVMVWCAISWWSVCVRHFPGTLPPGDLFRLDLHPLWPCEQLLVLILLQRGILTVSVSELVCSNLSWNDIKEWLIDHEFYHCGGNGMGRA